MPLQRRHTMELPPHETGGCADAGVHRPSGRVFLAHTSLR